MTFVPATCPSCGGNLQVPDDKDIVNCMYCKSSIVVREVIKTQSVADTTHLMEVAQTALDAGNAEEALSYFTQVLEYEAGNKDAWFGKAVSTGLSSSLANLRVREMLTYFGKAIDCSKAEDKRKAEEDAVAKTIDICTALHRVARKHMLEFVALESTWSEYLDQCKELMQILCAVGEAWSPGNALLSESVIAIAKDNVEGVKYFDKYDTTSLSINAYKHVDPQYAAFLSKLIAEHTQKIRKTNPGFAPPVIQVKKGCFVATAACGSADARAVVLLQHYRDRHLDPTPLGRACISLYNIIGPPLACLIKSSRVLRNIALCCVVRPAAKWAHRRMTRTTSPNQAL